MIISGKKQGQLGNQIYTLANQIASTRCWNVKGGVLAYNFSYINMFPNLKNIYEGKVYNCLAFGRCVDVGIRVLSMIPFFRHKFKYYSDVLADDGKKIRYWLENRMLDEYTVVSSSRFYDYDSLCDNYDYIKWCFEFGNEVKTRVDLALAAIRSENDLLVGVHIRRGDYISWRNGDYYFDDSTYYKAAISAINILGESEHVRFVICSDEQIDINHFDTRFELSNATCPADDLEILSRCDYIIATHSTFSGWASFVGKVPMFRISSMKNKPDCKEDFLVQFWETDGAGFKRDI